MPGGENPVGFPPDPDEEEQIEIIIAVLGEWFGKLNISAQDIEDCASNIADALNIRRCSLLEDAAEFNVLSSSQFSGGVDNPRESSD